MSTEVGWNLSGLWEGTSGTLDHSRPVILPPFPVVVVERVSFMKYSWEVWNSNWTKEDDMWPIAILDIESVRGIKQVKSFSRLTYLLTVKHLEFIINLFNYLRWNVSSLQSSYVLLYLRWNVSSLQSSYTIPYLLQKVTSLQSTYILPYLQWNVSSLQSCYVLTYLLTYLPWNISDGCLTQLTYFGVYRFKSNSTLPLYIDSLLEDIYAHPSITFKNDVNPQLSSSRWRWIVVPSFGRQVFHR